MSASNPLHPTEVGSLKLASQTWFFVGGTHVHKGGGDYIEGGAYVERYEPEDIRQSAPVVMIHGGVQTGSNFTATPDGRRGWLHDFLRAGYVVYILEQPERGRSGHALNANQTAPMQRYGAARVVERFTAPVTKMLWPQASTHQQWPGSGKPGDATFENFFASQVEMLSDRTTIEALNRDAGVALLDRIGPAVLLTHSQSGPFGWLIADARPNLVKAILAIEPNGPPFHEITFAGAPHWFHYQDAVDRPYGITREPLTFEPPLGPNEALLTEQAQAPADGLVAGYLQTEPARQLTHLKQVRIVIVVAESSYHAAYDHATSAFLQQAGVEHDFIRLEEHGIHGNGHMVMLEQNSHTIADLLLEWLADN